MLWKTFSNGKNKANKKSNHKEMLFLKCEREFDLKELFKIIAETSNCIT